MKRHVNILVIYIAALLNACSSSIEKQKTTKISESEDSASSFERNEKIGVFIPKDDASPSSWSTKHMWVGRKNMVASNWQGSSEFIKLWTDNGSVDSCNNSSREYWITPLNSGRINIYAIQRVFDGRKYDTIETINSFEAIKPPNITIIVTEDDSIKDFNFNICLVDRLTMKPMDKRYEIGRMYEVYVYDTKDNWLGKVEGFWETSFNFWSHSALKSKLKRGFKLKMGVLVRDTKTDLLIPTDEIIYRIN